MAAAPLSPATVARAVFKVQEALLDGFATSDRRLLLAAGDLLSRPDYKDVVEERSIDDRCGYPLCPNPLPPVDGLRRGRFRISLSEHRVYDLEEAQKYCSEACIVDSSAFSASLPAGRTDDLNQSKVERVIALFERPRESPKSSAELAKDGNLRMSKLTIREKEDAGKEEVSLNDWIGPSNAIEGYVPHFDLKQDSNIRCQEKSLKSLEDVRSKVSDAWGKENIWNATLIAEDSAIESLESKTMNISDAIAKKLDQVVLEEKKARRNKTSSELSKLTDKKNSNKSDNMDISGSTSTGHKVPPVPSDFKGSDLEHLDFTSAVLVNDECPQTSKRAIPKHRKQSGQNLKQDVKSKNTVEFKQSAIQELKGRDGVGEDSLLKSSLRTSGTKNIKHSVKWADEIEHLSKEERNDSLEMTNKTQVLHDEENDSSLRLVSAEACAAALSKASEVVASGLSEAVDAVSEVGIILLPQPQAITETAEDEDTMEIDHGHVKWPKKTILLDTDLFEVEDSWHDTPPEGFSLELSPFATMYMALFGWITRSSLAYLYGSDGNYEDEFSVVDGREYPCKNVLSDGRSLEIQRTINGCICRALPGLVMDLSLSIPVSTLENALGQLLDTMSFMEALPSFRLRQWQVIVLMFLEGLSIHRLPILASYLSTREKLSQMAQVLNAAHITGEEYQSMRDLIIPRGRFPESDAKRWMMKLSSTDL